MALSELERRVSDATPDDRPGGDPEPTASAAGASAGSQRGELLGFVAHEMRNPLSTALWSAELLARLSPQDRAGARGEKLTGMSLRALQRLRLLIEDHFLAERLDVRGIPIRMETVALEAPLRAAAGKAGAKELTIAVEPGLCARADRSLLDRALEAILSIAAREHAVIVECRRAGGRAIIVIRGAPPAPGALAPLNKGSASDQTGRALALHLSTRIAESLGGALTLEDHAYRLELPLPAQGENEG